MKFTGYSLITSFTPFHSIILKKHHRLPLNLCNKNSTKSRSLSTCAQKRHLHAKAGMGAGQYLPPLFR